MAKAKEDVVVNEQARIEVLQKHLNKNYRTRSASSLMEDNSSISTGSLALDLLLVRPLPPGIHEFAGAFGAGKTTIALHILANAKKAGYDNRHFINMERGLTSGILKSVPDVDAGSLNVIEPTSGEDACEAILEIFRTTEKAIVVLDSVTSLSATKAIIAKTMDEQTMGALGKLMSTFLSKANIVVHDSGGRLILLNQIRDSLDPYKGKFTPGGRANEHYCTSRVFLKASDSKSNLIAEGTNIAGKYITFELYKNRYSRAGLTTMCPLKFGSGIWKELELVTILTEYGIFEKAGAWYRYGGELIAQGDKNAMEWLMKDGRYEKLRAEILAMGAIPEKVE